MCPLPSFIPKYFIYKMNKKQIFKVFTDLSDQGVALSTIGELIAKSFLAESSAEHIASYTAAIDSIKGQESLGKKPTKEQIDALASSLNMISVAREARLSDQRRNLDLYIQKYTSTIENGRLSPNNIDATIKNPINKRITDLTSDVAEKDRAVKLLLLEKETALRGLIHNERSTWAVPRVPNDIEKDGKNTANNTLFNLTHINGVLRNLEPYKNWGLQGSNLTEDDIKARIGDVWTVISGTSPGEVPEECEGLSYTFTEIAQGNYKWQRVNNNILAGALDRVARIESNISDIQRDMINVADWENKLAGSNVVRQTSIDKITKEQTIRNSIKISVETKGRIRSGSIIDGNINTQNSNEQNLTFQVKVVGKDTSLATKDFTDWFTKSTNTPYFPIKLKAYANWDGEGAPPETANGEITLSDSLFTISQSWVTAQQVTDTLTIVSELDEEDIKDKIINYYKDKNLL